MEKTMLDVNTQVIPLVMGAVLAASLVLSYVYIFVIWNKIREYLDLVLKDMKTIKEWTAGQKATLIAKELQGRVDAIKEIVTKE